MVRWEHGSYGCRYNFEALRCNFAYCDISSHCRHISDVVR